jgi:Tol biopolymer transport system component
MKLGKVTLVLAAAALLFGQADSALQRAMRKETLEGDLKGAIDQYKKLAQGKDRAVAAKALVRMGQCYDKLGDTESRKAYERVVREFADQKESAAEARKFLAAKGGQGETGVVARVITAELSYRRYGRAVSRDGRYIACARGGPVGIQPGVLLHDLVSGEMRQLVKSKSMQEEFREALISPDGKQVAYTYSPSRNGRGEVYVVGIDGSAPRLLLNGGNAHAWSQDGKHILARAGQVGDKPAQKLLLPVAGGSPRVIGTGPMQQARLSPDGSQIAFVKSSAKNSSIFLQSVNGGTEIPLVENAGYATDPVWSPDGKRLLFLSDRDQSRGIWSIPVVNGAADGSPEFVKEGVGTLGRLLDFTPGGDFYYIAASINSNLHVASLDVQARKVITQPRQITSRHMNTAPAWSPDGEYLAYVNFQQSGPLKLMIRTVKTGEERELRPKEPIEVTWRTPPEWFPDSRSLFLETWDGKLYRVDVRTSEVRPLLDGLTFKSDPRTGRPVPVVLAPDGRTIYYLERQPDSLQTRILRRDLDGAPEREVCRVNARIPTIKVSPDGSRLLFEVYSEGAAGQDGNTKASWAIMTVAATGGQPKEVHRTFPERVYDPSWSRDGRDVLFVRVGPVDFFGGSDIYAIPAEGGEPLPFGIGPKHYLAGPTLHPDGKQLVFTDEEVNGALWVLKNLFPAAKAAK